MEYGKDEKGQEVLLKEGKFQVMMEWEKPYMHACIDALLPFGDVLEIGFGLGYSAERIQSYKPKSHTIIEYHPEVAKKARAFAAKYPHVTLVEGTWQETLPTLGVFDCIFFDDYPLESEQEMATLQKESAHSQGLLSAGNQLLAKVKEQLPFLQEIKYSDTDLEELVAQLPLDTVALQLARFFIELASRSQISEGQLQRQLAALIQEKKLKREEVEALLKPPCKKVPDERLFQFLKRCLESHMRSGSRFSCFLSSAESKFADEKFFNEIIVNPWLDFHEEEIVLEVPTHCDYFSGNKALVITIAKA